MITKKCPACWKDIQEKFGLSQQSNVVYNGSEETTTEISPNENDVPNEKVEFATTERVVLPQQRPLTSIEEKIEKLKQGKKITPNN